MFGLGAQETLVIIAMLAVFFFGPAIIRKFGKSAGEAVREGRAAAKELKAAIGEEPRRN